ncbi:hypothetical protein KAR48_17385 [bacterium]|nr:hypothetical protein [bacterium]
MKKILIGFCISTLLFVHITAQTDKGEPSPNEWTGSVEQKIVGLSTIWSEAKINFPFFDQVPDLDWDETYQKFISRVLATESIVDYYNVLTKFAALLQDGHSSVIPPWRFIKPGFDQPPVEIRIVNKKFVVARTGETEEMSEQHVYPGLEVIEIDGLAAWDYYRIHILPFSCQGTEQAHQSISLMTFLTGPKAQPLNLKVRDMDGTERSVTLTRNAARKNGTPFYGTLVDWFMFEPVMRHRMVDAGILYVQITNFMKEELNTQFEQMLDSLDLNTIQGMILDVRFNPGGSTTMTEGVVSCFIDSTVQGSGWKSLKYIPAFRSWGRETGWEESAPYTIEPREGKRYNGTVVVLTGNYTYSSAEDFLVPLKHSGRAVLVGGKTAGSTGNPIYVVLPGGGQFRVVSKRDAFPDGTEFVGYGIKPDVAVSATQQDYLDGRDVVLEKAVEVIKNWK